MIPARAGSRWLGRMDARIAGQAVDFRMGLDMARGTCYTIKPRDGDSLLRADEQPKEKGARSERRKHGIANRDSLPSRQPPRLFFRAASAP